VPVGGVRVSHSSIASEYEKPVSQKTDTAKWERHSDDKQREWVKPVSD